MGVVDRCPSITKESSERIQNAMREVSKGDCIVMGAFNHGDIQWNTLESTGVEDQQFMCLVGPTGQFPHSTCIGTNRRSKNIIFSSVFA